MQRTGKKPAQKPPLSPALRAAISNIAVDQGEGSDEETKAPVGPSAGASKANGGGGSAGQVGARRRHLFTSLRGFCVVLF